MSDPDWIIHQAHKEAEQKKSNFFIPSYHYSTVNETVENSPHNFLSTLSSAHTRTRFLGTFL